MVLDVPWNEEQTEDLFGTCVHARFAEKAQGFDLVFGGIVARPLYMCTESVGKGIMCENVASMTEHFQQKEGRAAYRCRRCMYRLRAQQAPGAASPPRRILWAYPIVWTGYSEPSAHANSVSVRTPLRVPSPMRLLVHVPPNTWAWNKGSGRLSEATVRADPALCSNGDYYSYNEQESTMIWTHSKPFKPVREWI